MASSGMPWIKLYNEFLDDPKIGQLTESSQLLFIKLLLVAGECDAEGALTNGDDPLTTDDLAWRLRMSLEEIELGVGDLYSASLIDVVDDTYVVVNFSKRQGRPQSEKRERWRERQRRRRDTSEAEETVTGDTSVTHAPRVEESREEESIVEVEVEVEHDGDNVDFRKLGSAWAAARGGLVNPLDSEELHTLQEEYTYQWVYDAIIEANSARSRGRNISMNFVKAILSRWHQEGKDTPYDHVTKATEAAKDEAAERTRRQVDEWEAKNA